MKDGGALEATMSKSRCTHDRVLAAMSEIVAGCILKDVSRKYGVSMTTLYRWRANVADKRKPEKDRLLSLEIENRRLKSKFAELSLDYTSLRIALIKDVRRDC